MEGRKMKKDIERIKAIQQSSEEEKTIFLTPILKHNFKTQLLAYSFVPNLEEKVWEMAHKTLLSYQETTPILFPFYLSREIHRTIQEETAAYLQEKKISIEPKILAFFQLKLSQLEGKFLTDSQITSILSIPESQVAHIEKEIKFYQEQYQEEVERLFPQYQEKLEQRKSYYNKV